MPKRLMLDFINAQNYPFILWYTIFVAIKFVNLCSIYLKYQYNPLSSNYLQKPYNRPYKIQKKLNWDVRCEERG